MQWEEKIIKDVFTELETKSQSSSVWKENFVLNLEIGIHLAILTEPFLTLILEGEKTVESRFARNRCGPFGKICPGDLVLLKRTAGPVIGAFIAGEIKFFPKLNRKILENIKQQYHSKICANVDSEFWEKRMTSQIATLIDIAHVIEIRPLKVDKTDRRGWVVLKQRKNNLRLDF